MVTERQMVANWKAVVEAVDDPLERIVTGLDHAEARCADQPEFFRMLIDLYTISLSSPALRVRCAALRTHLMDEIEVELRQVLGRLPAYSPVSYTHLDVYKRQVESPSRPPRATAPAPRNGHAGRWDR